MKPVALLLVLALAGCGEQSIFDPPKAELKYKRFQIEITDTDSLPPNVLGTATWVEGANVCLIKLREYPRCLLHEMRHGIGGAWHGETKSEEDC